MADAPWQGDACSLVEAFRTGKRSPVEELDATLAAIDASDLNAFAHLDVARARAAATAADLSVNDRVWVVATVTGSDANARLIVARSPKDASGDPTVTPPAVFQSSPFGIETT